VSLPVVKVTASVNGSETQRPRATSQEVLEFASVAATVVNAPAPIFSVSLLVTAEPVLASQAPLQVVGPVPVIASFER